MIKTKRPFDVKMSDTNKLSLVKRCIEKEKQGYDYVTPIKPVNSDKVNYSKGYAGQYDYDGRGHTTKYTVVMRKVEK